MYTAQQLTLKAHIEAENKAFAEQCQASGSQFWSTTTTDLDHWAGYGITTVEQYDRYMLEAEYSDLYKEVYGMRPRGYSDMSSEQLKSIYDSLVDVLVLEQKADEERKAMEQAEHKERKQKNSYQPNLAFAGLKDALNGCS